jgi:hypothetical protein
VHEAVGFHQSGLADVGGEDPGAELEHVGHRMEEALRGGLVEPGRDFAEAELEILADADKLFDAVDAEELLEEVGAVFAFERGGRGENVVE